MPIGTVTFVMKCLPIGTVTFVMNNLPKVTVPIVKTVLPGRGVSLPQQLRAARREGAARRWCVVCIG